MNRNREGTSAAHVFLSLIERENEKSEVTVRANCLVTLEKHRDDVRFFAKYIQGQQIMNDSQGLNMIYIITEERADASVTVDEEDLLFILPIDNNYKIFIEFMNEEDYSEFSRAINRIKKKEPTTRKRDFLKNSMTNLYGSIKNLAISEEKEEKLSDDHTDDIIFYYKSLASVRLKHVHKLEHEKRQLERQLRNSTDAEERHQNEARRIISAANTILHGSRNGSTDRGNGGPADIRAESESRSTFEEEFQSPTNRDRDE